MQIVLLNLPWNKDGYQGVRAGSRWPFTSKPQNDGQLLYIPFPFFLAYATALLKKKNKSAKLIDAIAERIKEPELFLKIKDYNPQLIVVETSTPSFKNDLRIIYEIHQQLPDSKIALCGPHASIFPQEILNSYSFIDYILIGEYEITLLNLVDALDNNLNLSVVLGLAYRLDEKIKINPRQPSIDDLNILPWPERSDVPIYNYNDGFANLPKPNVQMWASRGCPFQCIFCLWPQVIYNEHRHRMRNYVDVVAEMEYLVKDLNFKAVYFDDDVFNIDKEYTLSICKEIKRRKLDVSWAIMARVDLMDEEIIKSLADAGLYAIKYGIESADTNVLSFCKKAMDLDKAVNILGLTRKYGIKMHLTFCLGLPMETKNSILKTKSFLKSINPESFQFSFVTPFPGTEYFRWLKEQKLLLSEDWDIYDGNNKCLVKNDNIAASELEEIRFALCNNLEFK